MYADYAASGIIAIVPTPRSCRLVCDLVPDSPLFGAELRTSWAG
jgi:hypothetical protein